MGETLSIRELTAACAYAPDATFLVDTSGTIVSANEQARRMFGHRTAELVGQPIEVLMPERLREPHRTHRARYASEPAARPMGARLELTALRSDGHEFPVEISLSPVHAAEGLHVIASVRDITERVVAEAAVRRSEERFRLLAEHSREVVYRIRVDGDGAPLVVEYMSPAALAVLGHAPEEYYADPLLAVTSVHPDDRSVHQHWLLREHEEHPSPPIRSLRPDGGWVWLEFVESWVRDEAGNIVAMEGSARDVSQRVAAEEALRQSEEQFRLLAEQAADMIYIRRIEPSGHAPFEYVSPASYRLFGYSPEEFYANPNLTNELLHPDDLAARDAWARDRERNRVSPPLRYRRQDGSWAWVELRVSELTPGEGGAYRYEGIARDVTERVEAEEARHWMTIESEIESERVRIAHDLHDGVLGGLYGVGMELKAMARELEPASDDLSTRVSTTADDVGAISRDIRAYVMGLRSGQFTGDLEKSVADLCQHFETTSGIPTQLVADGLPEELGEDAAVAAFRVVQEALNNVRKHAEATAVEVGLTCDGEVLSARVRDNGRGFDPSRQPLSTSIGMRSMAHRAQSLGGTIRVASAPRRGTTVEVAIPVG